MDYKICPRCGGKVTNELVKCEHCSYVYPGIIVCPDCGNYQDFYNTRCMKCGYQFSPDDIDDEDLETNLDDDDNTNESEEFVKKKDKDYKTGDLFEYGKYTGCSILWRVLDIIDGKLLVISERIIDARRFDETTSNYNKSEIKKWLESDFKNEAFTTDEASNIDKIYLLSKDEVKKYFKTDEERKCKGTIHAFVNGLLDDYKNLTYSCYWTSKKNLFGAIYCVNANGEIFTSKDVNLKNFGVRVACIINKEKI